MLAQAVYEYKKQQDAVVAAVSKPSLQVHLADISLMSRWHLLISHKYV